VILTRSPLGLPQYCYCMDLVRLACVKHAASVRPEPGSNSPSRTRHRAIAHEMPAFIELERNSTRGNSPGVPNCDPLCRDKLDDLFLFHDRSLDHGELTDSLSEGMAKPRSRMTARTGVQSSLPFSRSRGSGTHSERGQNPWSACWCQMPRSAANGLWGRGANLATVLGTINPPDKLLGEISRGASR
jgi:hypothetical protein